MLNRILISVTLVVSTVAVTLASVALGLAVN